MIKLSLNQSAPSVNQRLVDAVQRKSSALETVEEALIRVGALKLSEKERTQYDAVLTAFYRGELNGLKGSDGTAKITKATVISAGTRIMTDRETSERGARMTDVIATRPPNYHILTADSELPPFVDRLRTECQRQAAEWKERYRVLGVDTMMAGDFEGTGIDTYIDISIGFSVWLPLLSEGYYLAYGHVDMRNTAGFEFLTEESAFKATDQQLTRSRVLSAITPYLSRPNHGKTFHMGSARYDLHVAIKDGYEIRGCVWDTLDAMRLMNEHEASYGLKPLITKYGPSFGITNAVYTFEDMFGKRSPAPFNTEIVGIYAINDVYYGWKLFEWQFTAMKNAPGRLLECYAEIDSKLPETDVFMGRCGFEIDIAGLRALEAEFTPLLDKAKADVVLSYGIDATFVRKMDRTINAGKIAEWRGKQEARISRYSESVARHRAIIAECEKSGKTALKRYSEATTKLAALLAEPLAAATEDNAPVEIAEFSITNGNHLAYLIYDYLGIHDRTSQFRRGKTRSTAADVLDAYYAEEDALKPLATVAAYEKLLNTYVTKIPDALEADGRLHTEFKAGGTSTGRYSSAGYSGRPIDILREFETEG